MRKIGVIGVGPVGITYAYSLIKEKLVDELVLIDINSELVESQVADLEDAVALDQTTKIKVGTYKDLSDANIVCITAGVAAKKIESRLDFVEKNSQIITSISNELMENGFAGKILLSSNPVDLMTKVCQDATGLNPNHVIGSGTVLDTARLRKELARELNVNIKEVDTLVIGEHGDSSVAIYSQTKVGCKLLEEYIKENNLEVDLDDVCEKMRTGGYRIFNVKGETSYGIASYLAMITNAIINDTKELLPVTVLAQGEYGITDVTIPLLAVIGSDGVEKIEEIKISEEEQKQLTASAELLDSIYKTI